MKKRVFVVHGWGGTPDEGWFPWLKAELLKLNFDVEVPQLPDTDTPQIVNWVPALGAAVADPDKNTYFVGHSLGCQTIARYLEGLHASQAVGGAVFVAGFFKHLTNLETSPNYESVEKDWMSHPPDLAKVRGHLPKSIAIFSDDDPYVPLDNQDDFATQLGSEVQVLHGMKHFSGDEGCIELPEALEAILKISS